MSPLTERRPKRLLCKEGSSNICVGFILYKISISFTSSMFLIFFLCGRNVNNLLPLCKPWLIYNSLWIPWLFPAKGKDLCSFCLNLGGFVTIAKGTLYSFCLVLVVHSHCPYSKEAKQLCEMVVCRCCSWWPQRSPRWQWLSTTRYEEGSLCSDTSVTTDRSWDSKSRTT